MSILLLFTICTAVNVILSTIKSIATINGGKFMASLMNALTYGFYSYVIILTNTDGVSTLDKMIITAVCNFICVYLVKWGEEKFRKDRLWKIEATVPKEYAKAMIIDCNNTNLKFNYIDIGKWFVFNFYAYSQEESKEVAKLVKYYGAKYFVSESKTLTL